jgi:putative tricarboxylic transport membrane protein
VSNSSEASPRSGPLSFIRNPQDFWGGAGLLALALVAYWASRNLPGQQGFAFGPGTAPRLFMFLLGINALAIMLGGLLFQGPAVEYSIPAFILIIAASAFWAAVNYFVGMEYATGALIVVSLVFLKYLDRSDVRGVYFITIAVLGFAAFIRPLGLIISTFLLVLISAAASREVRWIEAMVWGVVLALFCAFLFPYVLNLPMQLWPRFV